MRNLKIGWPFYTRATGFHLYQKLRCRSIDSHTAARCVPGKRRFGLTVQRRPLFGYNSMDEKTISTCTLWTLTTRPAQTMSLDVCLDFLATRLENTRCENFYLVNRKIFAGKQESIHFVIYWVARPTLGTSTRGSQHFTWRVHTLWCRSVF